MVTVASLKLHAREKGEEVDVEIGEKKYRLKKGDLFCFSRQVSPDS